MPDSLFDLWVRAREAMLPLEERREAAKLAAKVAAADVMIELWSPELDEEYEQIKAIFEEYDVQLRAEVVAGGKFPGAHTTTKKTAQIDEAAAVKWALKNKHKNWVAMVLTKEARKEIEAAITDRLHPLYGTVPETVATFVEKKSAVFTDAKMIDPRKVKE